MKNLGKVTQELLAEIGIMTFEQIQELGAIEVYKRMKRAYPKWTSLNLLWGLEEPKAELKKMLEE